MIEHKTHLCDDGKPEDYLRVYIDPALRRRLEGDSACADSLAMAHGEICAAAASGQARTENRCGRLPRVTTLARERASNIAKIMAASDLLAGNWATWGDKPSLVLERVVRAACVALAAEDPRLPEMEAIARKILVAHDGFVKTETFVEETWLYPPGCAQPYEATFQIYGGDSAGKTPGEVACRLREVVMEFLGIVNSTDHLALARRAVPLPVETQGRMLANALYTSLVCQRPDVEKPAFQVPSLHDGPRPPAVLEIGKAIARVLDNTERSQWAKKGTAEGIVRRFFRGLGMSENEAESLFDAERKRRKRRAAGKAPKSEPPEGEGNGGTSIH
jgi:hypothetical protein